MTTRARHAALCFASILALGWTAATHAQPRDAAHGYGDRIRATQTRKGAAVADVWVNVRQGFFSGSGGTAPTERLSFYAATGNDGPDIAPMVRVAFVFDAVLPDLSVEEKGDLDCAAPVIGAGTTTVNCSAASFAPVNSNADLFFDASVPQGERLVMVAASIVADADDPYPADNTSSAVTAIISNADLGVRIDRSANTATDAVYVVTVRNSGPDPVSNIALYTTSNLLNDWTSTPPLRFSVIDDRWRCFIGIDNPFGRAWTCSLFSALESGDSSTFTVTVPLSMHKAGYSFESSLQTRFDPALRNNSARMRLGMPAPRAAAMGHDYGMARIDVNVPQRDRSRPNSARRMANHDPAVVHFGGARRTIANVLVAVGGNNDPVAAGRDLDARVYIQNTGPDTAEFPSVGIAFGAVLPGLTLIAPAGWSCDAPTTDTGTTIVACAAKSLISSGSATFQLNANAPSNEAGSGISMAASARAETFDPDMSNNSATSSLNVGAQADLRVRITGPVANGSSFVYSVVVDNQGPSDSGGLVVRIQSNFALSAMSFSNTNTSWVCQASSDGSIVCTQNGIFASGAAASFDITVPRTQHKAGYAAQAAIILSQPTQDPNPSNNRVSRRFGMPVL